MKSTFNKWIIYDGNCGLCLKSKLLLTKMGILSESRCLNYHELDSRLKSKVDADRFRFEMALVDEGTGETLYGLEGILSIFSQKVSGLSMIKPGGWMFSFLEFFYHTISYNRFFLFPKKKVFACDCDPPFEYTYFWRWIGICLMFALGVSFLLGYVSANFFGMSPTDLGAKTLLIVGFGWLTQIIISRFLMTDTNFRDYSQHLALIALVGVLILLPTILLSFFVSKIILGPLLIVTIALSSGIMSLMHFKRVGFLSLSQGWTVTWFLCLQASALFFSHEFKLLVL